MNIGATLEALRDVAVETNAEIADALLIPRSTAITCVKPSGTVSQLVDSASGIHARHNPHYIRTVRGDNKDPLTQFLISEGIPAEPDVMKPDSTTVFSFPMASPRGAVTRTLMTALEQLELWLLYQRYWCEHKPSVTISVKENEWMDVGAWVYKHFDEVSGISFLPFSDHTYAQAPYQDCTEDEYENMLTKMPVSVNWSRLQEFEKEDTTSGGRELACTAGVCEVVDLNAA
jgi:ribonucleoside-diphosphate reductase alpha chain